MHGGASTEAEYRLIRKRQLHGSPTNPRKEFAEEGLAELADSIRERGVVVPLIVRRWPEKDRAGEEAYEIVSGERRFRAACRVEGLERLPAMVRVLSDQEALEVQLIENLQRQDVSPFEEAMGYSALLAMRDGEGLPIYSVELIARKVGKSPRYVGNRLKITRAPKFLLQAQREGKIGVRQCEQVGRIPHGEDRERLAREVLQSPHYDRPMTAVEVADHIREHYMISLDRAPFDTVAEELVPKAGSCAGCVYRTGNDPELAEELASGRDGESKGRRSGIDPNLCQNPKCYREKCEAYLATVRSREPGRVLSEEEAREVFDEWGNVKHTGKLKRADRKPDAVDVGHFDQGKLKTWGDYAGRLGVPVRLAKNPRTGEVVALVEAGQVKRAEAAAAPEKPVFVQKGAPAPEKGGQEEAKRKRELEGEEIRVAFDTLAGNLVGQMGRLELVFMLGQAADHQGIDLLLRWMDLKPGAPGKGAEFASARGHKLEFLISAVRDDGERYDREAILILILMAQFCEGVSYHGLESVRFREFASARGVDFKEVSKAAKEALKERSVAGKAPKATESPVIGDQSSVIGDQEEESSIRMMGSFQVNENNVVLNPETVELVNLKGFVATAKLALIGNVWYSGHDLIAKSSEARSPVIYRPQENWGHDLRNEAIAWEADNARAFFEHEERSGKKVPPAVYTTLKGFLIKDPAAVEETPDPSARLAEDLATVVRHFGRRAGTCSVDTVKIQQELGWPSDRAISVINELRGRRMIVMGCLDRDSAAVKGILEG